MTGFARVRRTRDDGEIVLSLKSLNHRSLDMHFHLPHEFDAFEPALRAAVKGALARGHVEIRFNTQKARSPADAVLNKSLLASYIAAFREAAAAHGVAQEPDLNAAMRVDGMLTTPKDEEPDAELESIVLELTREGLEALNAFRQREGEETADVLRARSAAIRLAANQIAAIRGKATEAFQTRLRDRLFELLKGASIEPQRLAQEAAILADRSDIGEEIARLEIHTNQLDKLLAAGGEVGKKLDFLLQEMNRETNTILSKTNGIGETGLTITDLALGIKSDIEKIREQSLNLE